MVLRILLLTPFSRCKRPRALGSIPEQILVAQSREGTSNRHFKRMEILRTGSCRRYNQKRNRRARSTTASLKIQNSLNNQNVTSFCQMLRFVYYVCSFRTTTGPVRKICPVSGDFTCSRALPQSCNNYARNRAKDSLHLFADIN